ncbi:Fe-S cluster assembly protein SufB [Candidatus Shikimatogenerans bostrichidophilus]|uniref:Fe-S cluster assembly protein SufB n=1 Tax=Candidatus Shikimatogenerans bostrichidophilus TaxID=2943807 RepID=UPI002965E2A3
MKIKNNIYKYGFYTNIKSNTLSIGINKKIIKKISKLKNEPKWMTKWRLKSFKYWKKLKYPKWSNLNYKKINFNLISYFSEIVKKNNKLDKKIIKTFEKLGVPIKNNKKNKKVSIDFIFDSTSITTTYKKILNKYGIIFCSINEAITKYSNLIKKYMGTVVSYKDNYYASLNSAVFSDGSFCYIPKGVKCPIDLSTYFRINNSLIGQFERTLIIVDEGGSVSYLEGCTAPIRKKNQLHGAVVELIALKNANIKYSTVQNWYPGNKKGKGGIYNFVTKRGICNKNSKITWIQLETGSLLTWKYPSCILKGDNSIGEFRSVSLTKNYQQIDTGTKMIHIGKNTKSIIISKSICMDKSINTYRGLVKINKNSKNSNNYTQCDSLLIGNKCSTHTLPYIISTNSSAKIEHESTISNIEEEQIYYCNQRGINNENAMSIIVNGFSMEIIKELPLEFALEAKELLNIKLKNTVG